jgi:hypothetical protein
VSPQKTYRGHGAGRLIGFGGLAQLLAFGMTRPQQVASRPLVAGALAAVVACVSFLACGFVAQKGVSGPARLIWAIWGSFWAGWGFWLVSLPFTLSWTPPIKVASGLAPAFVYPFPLTYEGFDFARDLAAVLFFSLSSGLITGGLGLLFDKSAPQPPDTPDTPDTTETLSDSDSR